jgi:hypothetical protein
VLHLLFVSSFDILIKNQYEPGSSCFDQKKMKGRETAQLNMALNDLRVSNIEHCCHDQSEWKRNSTTQQERPNSHRYNTPASF